MSIRSEGAEEASRRELAAREMDLPGIGRAMSRRRWWVIGPTLACFALAVLFVSLVQPRYTGEAKVIVENGETYFTRPDKSDQQQVVLPDDEAVQSQVQLVLSRDIARQAIDRLGLKGNPDFDPLAHGLNPVSRLLVVLGLQRDPTLMSPEDRILDTYYERLTVFALTKSRVIAIEFTANDSALAARGANTIAELYLEAQSSAKRAAAHAAATSLSTLVSDLQRRAGEAEAEADAFRTRSGLLVGTNNNTISTQQLGDINTQLAQARTAEADAQAKAKLIREMIREGRVGDIPDIANNELIRRVSEQRVNLRAEIALQSRTLLPGHPHMQELNAQIADVDNQLRAAGEKAMRTLENDARIAADRVDNLQAALDAQKKAVSTAGADQVQLNALELKARLLKEQLEFNTAKYQEAAAREDAGSTPADARMISRAVPPQQPSFPKKLPLIGIITLAGALLSAGIQIAREFLSGRAFEDEAVTTAPRRVGPGRVAPPAAAPVREPLAVERPSRDEDGLEAALRTLGLRTVGSRATRVLVVASTAQRDAAPAAMSFARLLARDTRSILVDFDSATPAVTPVSLAAIAPDEDNGGTPGISDLLLGNASFAEVIHRDRASRLHLVPVGGLDLNAEPPSEIDPILDALSETYDFVVMHAPPPTMQLTRVLSDHADVGIILLGDGVSDAETRATREMLEQGGTKPVFTIPLAALALPLADQDAA